MEPVHRRSYLAIESYVLSAVTSASLKISLTLPLPVCTDITPRTAFSNFTWKLKGTREDGVKSVRHTHLLASALMTSNSAYGALFATQHGHRFRSSSITQDAGRTAEVLGTPQDLLSQNLHFNKTLGPFPCLLMGGTGLRAPTIVGPRLSGATLPYTRRSAFQFSPPHTRDSFSFNFLFYIGV